LSERPGVDLSFVVQKPFVDAPGRRIEREVVEPDVPGIRSELASKQRPEWLVASGVIDRQRGSGGRRGASAELSGETTGSGSRNLK
jgi:hypothetical protein